MFSNLSPGKIYRNKFFIGTLCIIFAVLIGFAVVPTFNAQTRKTVKVWRATQTIYEYQKITSNMVSQVEVGSYGLPKQVIPVSQNIVGKTAKAKIVEGDNIMAGQLISGNENTDEFLSQLSSQGKRAVSVTLPTLAASVSGQIKAGDVVSVITFKRGALSDPSGGSSSSAVSSSSAPSSSGFNAGISGNTTAATTDKVAVQYPELKYIQVAALSDKSGQAVNGVTVKKNSNGDTTILPATVTFACTDEQAQLLAEIEKKNDLYLVFVARGPQAEKIMKQQDTNSSSSSVSSSSAN